MKGLGYLLRYLLVRLVVTVPLVLALGGVVALLVDAADLLLPPLMPVSLRAAARGSALLALASAAIAVPGGVAAAAVLHERALSSRLFAGLASALGPVLGGPSVLTGLFAAGLLIRGLGLAGSFGVAVLTLALWLLPRVAIASLEVLGTLPRGLWEEGLALGASRSAVLWVVVVPACASRLASAALQTLALAVGQAAPLLLVLGQGVAASGGGEAGASLSLPTLAFAAATGEAVGGRPLAAASLCLLLALQAGLASLGHAVSGRVGSRGRR